MKSMGAQASGGNLQSGKALWTPCWLWVWSPSRRNPVAI